MFSRPPFERILPFGHRDDTVKVLSVLSRPICLAAEFHQLSEVEEIRVGPDIQLVRIVQKRTNIFFDTVYVCPRQSFAELVFELVEGYVLPIELEDALMKVIPIQGDAVPNVPFEVIPVTTFYPLLPGTEDQRMQLAGV